TLPHHVSPVFTKAGRKQQGTYFTTVPIVGAGNPGLLNFNRHSFAGLKPRQVHLAERGSSEGFRFKTLKQFFWVCPQFAGKQFAQQREVHGRGVKMQAVEGIGKLGGYDVGEASESLTDLPESAAEISQLLTDLQRHVQVSFHDGPIPGFGTPKPLACPQGEVCQRDLRRQLSYRP